MNASLPYRVLLLVCLMNGLAASSSQAAPPVEYNRDVRPILSDKCFLCHGPDKNTRKAGLRLDSRDSGITGGKSGKAALVPGKPSESELVRRILTHDDDDLMPPAEHHKPLTDREKDVLQRWVEQGAAYQAHWAYTPLVRPTVPGTNQPASANAIDAFVRAELRRHQADLSPGADRAAVLRRLSLDLTGLPPTPAEVSAFVADRRADAYEREVSRLLRSPHHGERMAVGWLDVVRYADTVGYHGDQNVNVFPYRDYVVESFNRNKRFDQFTIEQLAGDLLAAPTAEQRIATAFNRLNMVTREGGAQPGEYLAKYTADRVRTVAGTWLGSTLGCAECHDHKFDPFTTRDFYSLGAFFADVKQWGVYSDYTYTPNPELKGWSNDHPFPPEMEADVPYLAERARRLSGQIAKLSTTWLAEEPAARRTLVETWRREMLEYRRAFPSGWTPSVPELTAAPTNSVVDRLGTVTLPADRKKTELVLRLPLDPGWLAAVRLELPAEGTNGVTLKNDATTFGIEASFAAVGADKPVRLVAALGDATPKEARFENGFEVDGTTGAWRTSETNARATHTAVWALAEPRRVRAGDSLVITLKNDAIRAVRVAVSPLATREPLAAGRLDLGQPVERLVEPFLLSTDAAPDARRSLYALHREWRECREGRHPVVVTVAARPMPSRVLPRGNWQDESGATVEPAVPAFLPRGPARQGDRLTRMDLARWLVSPENPLTARTVMNRLWKQFFGNGLSAQVDDLGAQGEWPTHPELLDWMACEFRESGWDMQHMIRLIVGSQTYRQSSNLRAELRDADPQNRWLSSQNPRRLEAEFVRDNALAIAGLINLDVGGPSVRPYQPPGYYANLQFPDRDYAPHTDERRLRRGLYMHWQRTFLHPMLANFDAPAREECTAQRVVSNTPQQALTLLNDPVFFEAARALAERLRREAATDPARIEAAFRLALARAPKPAELKSLTDFLALQRREVAANGPGGPGTDPETAVWIQFARVILNLHETVTRY
jgi:hypothetical protein